MKDQNSYMRADDYIEKARMADDPEFYPPAQILDFGGERVPALVSDGLTLTLVRVKNTKDKVIAPVMAIVGLRGHECPVALFQYLNSEEAREMATQFTKIADQIDVENAAFEKEGSTVQ